MVVGRMKKEDKHMDLDDAIRRHVHRVFEKYARNVSKAATALKITRTTLRKWLTAGTLPHV